MKMKRLFTILLIVLTYQIHAQNLSDSLLLYLPFNNSAVDESGNNNTIKVFGAQLTTDRFNKENSAYYFNGTDSYIQIIPDSNWSNISDFTVSIWFKAFGWHLQSYLNILDGQYIFDGHSYSPTVTTGFFRDGFDITMILTNDIGSFFRDATGDLDGPNFLIDVPSESNIIGTWHNNVFVRKGDSTFSYLDGKLVTKALNDSAILDMDHNLYLGAASGNNPYVNAGFKYNFYGKIDDVRFYNRALDSTDVAYLYYGTCGLDRVIYDTIAVSDTLIIDVSLSNFNTGNNTNTIKVYPNPAKDIIHIDNGDYSKMTGYKIRISDMNGKYFFETAIDRKIMSINISDMGAKGIYLIQILDNNSSVVTTRKILLE